MADHYEMSDWSQLFDCLLDLICESFTFEVDFIRFGCVCSSWRSVYVDNIHRPRTRGHQIPMLMIPLKNHQEETLTNQWSLYSLAEKRVHKFRISVPDNMTCAGSSFGWLVSVATDDNECYPVTLFNPFLPVHCNQIELPSLHNFPSIPKPGIPKLYVDGTTLKKAILSTNPTTTSSTDYTVMAIYGGCSWLAFWKPGDKNWTSVMGKKDAFGKPAGPYKTDSSYEDIICHKGLFYGVRQEGNVMVCDINSDDPKLKIFAPPPLGGNDTSTKYIVESSGDLYQVQRIRIPDITTYITYGFKVFKLLDNTSNKNEDGKWNERKWIKVNTLNGYAFFIGKNASMSLSPSDFLGCKPNCIYFTDDYNEFNSETLPGRHEMAVFNVEYKRFEHHYCKSKELDTAFFSTKHIWVEPTLWGTMVPTTLRLQGGGD